MKTSNRDSRMPEPEMVLWGVYLVGTVPSGLVLTLLLVWVYRPAIPVMVTPLMIRRWKMT